MGIGRGKVRTVRWGEGVFGAFSWECVEMIRWTGSIGELPEDEGEGREWGKQLGLRRREIEDGSRGRVIEKLKREAIL